MECTVNGLELNKVKQYHFDIQTSGMFGFAKLIQTLVGCVVWKNGILNIF